jgi:hypothetical protein
MKLYLNCTANLGDFLNVMPVLSGIYKSYGKIDFTIRADMKKFKGLKEFLMYQGIFSDVNFDDEVFMYGEVKTISSWTREDRNDENRPIETCRYENWMKDKYHLEFEVDDKFILKVEELDLPIDKTVHFAGDRWSGLNIDGRRQSWTLAHLDKLKFIDYNNSLMENAYIIKHCKSPFISTFTGISGLADLLNKEQIVLWGEDIRDWDNKPITYSFEKHYYGNRNSRLMYLGDFELDRIDEYFTVQE